ncbi:MAG: hypothetical protein IJ202_09745 [Bacteroidales bacterium]|nr:hypothetical protein [Bacteroidales bacterium]
MDTNDKTMIDRRVNRGKLFYFPPEFEEIEIKPDSPVLEGSGFQTDDWERDPDILG